LAAGQLDAVEALEPYATTLRKAGDPTLGDPFASIAEPLATNFWIAQGSWAATHRAAISDFVAALSQAQVFINQNPGTARQILQQYTRMPAAIASSVPLPTYDFAIRTQDLTTWIGVLKFIGQLNGSVDPTKLVLRPGT
jgi:NitT/TauT family transport system substrate-binding protein